ncbi:sirohydrochlorin chelatase [Pseudazoarcus pumilus]|uniref:Cobalamin biosynthesis protein CbiX n=1 Tax=Pseudazoarcus pumilus TaxID=2067960 RepID=A0A2I6S447_9RHOO|nr:CbiX/SirB N-terminal domain-containing protein [Pseudazoarcus pumilus]AUN94036.1 cobalamin biosynthesis protein CbiX [Pseudazoarcus pumilus]
MSESAIVLFGHGARDPQWAEPMCRAREILRRAAPDTEVELAFLEFMQPGLVDTIDCLARGGARRITVVPMFLAQGGHVKKDLPDLLDAARERHPTCQIELVPAVGESDMVIAAMAEYALRSAGVLSAHRADG